MIETLKQMLIGNPDGQTLFQKMFSDKETSKVSLLPFKVGDVISLDISSDLILGEKELLFRLDDENKATIKDIGVIMFNDITKYRVYCNLFDSQEEFFLQYTYQDKKLVGIELYNTYEEMGIVKEYHEAVTPDRKIALNFWLGDNGILGSETFNIDDVVFSKYLGKITEKENRGNFNVEHQSAYYGRNLNANTFSGRELCLVSLSRTSENEAYLSIFLGVEITESQINIF